MLQIAYGLTSMIQASDLHWHKRSKYGVKNVRADARSERETIVSWASEHQRGLRKFVIFSMEIVIKTINRLFGVGLATLHRIILEDLNMRNIFQSLFPGCLMTNRKKDAYVTAFAWMDAGQQNCPSPSRRVQTLFPVTSACPSN